jgi:hypothetical protein
MDYTDYSSGADYSSTELTAAQEGLLGGLSAGMLVFLLVISILSIIGLWKIFTKAGKPGWASIIPIYNLYVLLQIVGRPTWWLLLFLAGVIPFVGLIPLLVASVIVSIDLAKSFGKDLVYGILLFLFQPIMFIVLGFGKDKYVGPSVKSAAAGAGAGSSSASSPAAAPKSPAASDSDKPAPPQV